MDFYGKPSHAAAAPWDGVNALEAVLAAFHNINALRLHLKPESSVHGIISKGGDAANIIPEHTQAKFYLRAKTRTYLDEIVDKVKDCARAGALATGARVEFSKNENDFDDMLNNMTLAERVRDYMEGDLGSGAFELAPEHFGSIDMGNVSHVVPGIHMLVDIANGKPLSPHTYQFAEAAASPYAGEIALRAAQGLALTGYDVLNHPEFRQRAQHEFEETKARLALKKTI
jgi:metal-dependent amidase/aminoacylase/carboxypeptidase family protein